MHIRLSDRHAGKAAEAPVVPRPGLFRFSIWRAARLDRFSGDNRDCFASRHDGDIDRWDEFLFSDFQRWSAALDRDTSERRVTLTPAR